MQQPIPTLSTTALPQIVRTGGARTASKWTIAAFGGSQLVRVFSNVLLAHLLSPDAFGLTALVGAIIAGLQSFSDVGIAPVLVRSARGEDTTFRHTAWTLGVVRGLTIWALTFVIAVPVSHFYDHRLAVILPVAGASAFIGSLASSSLAILSRHMQLRGITLLDLSSSMFGVIITCLWAWHYPTVWAMIWGGLAGSLFRTVGSWMLVPGYRDTLAWDISSLQEIVSFGRWILLSTVVTFLAAQADRLLLGKLLTLEEFGVYSIAVGLAMMPRELISRLASSVQYPILARCARDRTGELAASFFKTRQALLLVAQWALLAIALGAQGFFSLLYSTAYADAVEITRWLSLATFISMLSISSDRALLALGDSRTLAITNVVRAVTIAPGCLIGYWLLGLPGFIAGLTASALAGHIVLIIALRRHGINTLANDLLYLTAYVVLLSGPLAFSDHVLRIGAVRRIDIGQALCGFVVLLPLGLVAGYKLRGLLRR